METIAGERELLEMALVGCRNRKEKVEKQIAEIERQLGMKRTAVRKRTAAVQSRRWEAYLAQAKKG